ncbi:hypothetical protein P167DRAFT_547976 [Morchella conica CCBAS932]|uniref:Uncharacterized protein n=1 Tax=Morchella conica CCBAS932 TaxID=1392247 RepID=A0A3N4KG84_9PEZI|nr:hypothetical protein P167DRAFT_547976 [Morchella conica CCBAS932]
MTSQIFSGGVVVLRSYYSSGFRSMPVHVESYYSGVSIIAYGRERIFVCHYRGYACIENNFARTDSFGIAQKYATIEDMLLSRLLLSGLHSDHPQCLAGHKWEQLYLRALY